MSRKVTNGLDLLNRPIDNVSDPSTAQQAATKNYVDNTLQSITDLKDPVRAVSTGNVVLASGLTNGTSIDGVSLVTGDRVLLKNQTTASENGIYVVVASGAASRSTDADANAEVTRGFATTVLEGTTKGTGVTTANPVTFILNTSGAVVLGTTSLSFVPIGSSAVTYTAGNGLSLSGGSFSVNAGNGIIADGTSTRIDPSVVVRKFAVNNTNATSSVANHNFGTRDVTVTVYDTSTFEEVLADVVHTDTNNVTVSFATAPAAGAYRIVVQG